MYQRILVSSDADLPGDTWIDLSQYEESDLELSLEEFCAHIRSLTGPKSNLYEHFYMRMLVLDNPVDGNEAYFWEPSIFEWSEVFDKLGRKHYCHY